MNTPKNSADMRMKRRTASYQAAKEMLFSFVDRKGLIEISKIMKKAGDQQSVDLLREIQSELLDQLSLDSRAEDALSRLVTLASRGKSWDPGLIRNNIFKAANSLGIRLPSGMFASKQGSKKPGYSRRVAAAYDRGHVFTNTADMRKFGAGPSDGAVRDAE